MTSYPKDCIFRVVVPVHRMEPDGSKVEMMNSDKKDVTMLTPRKVEEELTAKI